MPRNPASDIQHVVFTDHAIQRRAPPPGGFLPANADLVPFGGDLASTRDLGLVYAMVGLREQNSTYVERAFHLLQETVASGGADAQTLAYLAEFYRDRKDDAHALPLYERTWQLDPTQSAVAAARGAYQMQRGNIEQAIRFWNQALAIKPALVLVRTNLATAVLRTGYAEQAQATLQQALEFQRRFRRPEIC
jgi:tetratricopeptide (TPR) repeat protein